MSETLQMYLLGRWRLCQNGVPLTALASAKAQALLSYLAVTGQPHARHALAGLLWGELPEQDGRRNLRGVLSKLRPFVAPYLSIDHQTVALRAEAAYWLDTAHFVRLSESNEPQRWREALTLYHDEFLAEFAVRQAPLFDEWVTRQRQRYHLLALKTCLMVVDDCLSQQMYEEGTAYVRRLLTLDPIHEAGQKRLMMLLALSGQRSAALAQYERWRHRLWEELSVAPSAETAVLAERIRAGRIDPQGNEVVTTVTARTRPQVAPPTRQSGQTLAPIQDRKRVPFIAGPPIQQPAQFFGRGREVKRIFNLLKRMPLQNAAIIGPRRSGKTSLLHYLRTVTQTAPEQLRVGQRRDWLPHPHRYRWLFVDFQDPRLGEQSALLRYLLQGMQLPIPERCDLELFLDIVSEQLQQPTVILLDEIGVALTRYPSLDDAFWESLRSLATNQVEGQLAFVLASAAAPAQLAQQSGFGSPFFNIFGYTATLGALREAEVQALIASSPLPFASEDARWIIETSGGWPMLAQILCRECLLAMEEGEEDDYWREEGLRQIAPFKIVRSNSIG